MEVRSPQSRFRVGTRTATTLIGERADPNQSRKRKRRWVQRLSHPGENQGSRRTAAIGFEAPREVQSRLQRATHGLHTDIA